MRSLETITENALSVSRNPVILHKGTNIIAKRQKEFLNKASPLYPFFSTLQNRDLRIFMSFLRVVDFSPGQRIIRSNTIDPAVFFIYTGKLTSFQAFSHQSSFESTQIVSQGQIIGLKQFLDGKQWHRDIICKTSGTLLKLSKSMFDDLLTINPSTANKVLNRLIRWECYEVLDEANSSNKFLSGHRMPGVLSEKDVFVEIQFFAPGVRTALSIDGGENLLLGQSLYSQNHSGIRSPQFIKSGQQSERLPPYKTLSNQSQGGKNINSPVKNQAIERGKFNVTFQMEKQNPQSPERNFELAKHPLFMTQTFAKFTEEQKAIQEEYGDDDPLQFLDEGMGPVPSAGSTFVKQKIVLQAQQRKKDKIRLRQERKFAQLKGTDQKKSGRGESAQQGNKTGRSQSNKKAQNSLMAMFDQGINFNQEAEQEIKKYQAEFDKMKAQMRRIMDQNDNLRRMLREEKQERQILDSKAKKSAMNVELLKNQAMLQDDNFFKKQSRATTVKTTFINSLMQIYDQYYESIKYAKVAKFAYKWLEITRRNKFLDKRKK